MANEGGAWIMKGLAWDDPWRIRSWREIIPATGEVAYGKFFNNKTGFISREWFPYFANARRDGYDFDAAWDDGLVQRRCRAIMDICEDGGVHPGYELKSAAGFGKGGYKNFEGCMTQLLMQTYLIIRKFERRKNQRGESYGMAVSFYQKPEELWGYEHVTSAYREEPAVSAERILRRAKERFPGGDDDYADDRIEVGFSVVRGWQGRGFATEALTKVLAYLTENEGISCVTAWCAAENTASKKVLEKSGMKLVGTEKGGLTVDGRVYDKLIYEYRVTES